MKNGQSLAAKLLEIEAIKLQLENPFVWASGIHSPIYCDNRTILSYPGFRTEVVEGLVQLAGQQGEFDTIAGVATAGISWATLLADRLGLPMVYVRSKAKSHGAQNQIEGRLGEYAKCLVVEDLFSTAKSSLVAVDALRHAGAEVCSVISIFTYGFEIASKNFEAAKTAHASLATYADLMDVVEAQKLFSSSQLASLAAWRQDPQNWS